MKNNLFTQFLLCGIVGWSLECFWTGLHSLFILEPTLSCNTSLWMFPIYGLAAFTFPLYRKIAHLSFYIRGLLYTILMYFVEFTTGSFLKAFHACPWNYDQAPLQLCGLVRLDYAPLWLLSGLLFERLLVFMHSEKDYSQNLNK